MRIRNYGVEMWIVGYTIYVEDYVIIVPTKAVITF
jgi:hypothetical protein